MGTTPPIQNAIANQAANAEQAQQAGDFVAERQAALRIEGIATFARDQYITKFEAQGIEFLLDTVATVP